MSAASSTAASGRTAQPADKHGDGTLREDTAPLTSRFPGIGTPTKVRWMSGTLGTSPGPSTYWIDAVVWVTPEVGQQLRATSPQPSTEAPTLVAGVRAALPDGILLTSDALRSRFQTATWWPNVYILKDADVVVISALGE